MACPNQRLRLRRGRQKRTYRLPLGGKGGDLQPNPDPNSNEGILGNVSVDIRLRSTPRCRTVCGAVAHRLHDGCLAVNKYKPRLDLVRTSPKLEVYWTRHCLHRHVAAHGHGDIDRVLIESARVRSNSERQPHSAAGIATKIVPTLVYSTADQRAIQCYIRV